MPDSKRPLAGRWRRLTSAPHHMLFAAGAVQWLLAMALWAADRFGTATGWWHGATTTVAQPSAHAYLMIYGVLPLFLFGYLLTVYPRWLDTRPVARGRYLRSTLTMVAGAALFYAGLGLGAELAALGIALQLGGWCSAQLALLDGYFASRAAEKRHATLLNCTLGWGALGAAAFALWLMSGASPFVGFALPAGVWLLLVPAYVSVAHRMIPQLTSSILPHQPGVQPRWTLPLVAVAAPAHLVLDVTELTSWRWLADLPLALMALHHSRAWELRRSLGVRLLALPQVAFLWFGLAMALYTLQSLGVALGRQPGLEAVALHTLGVGFFGGMTLAMATRVSLGRAGLPLRADGWTWAAFVALHGGCTVLALAMTPVVAGELSSAMVLLAAAAWLAAGGIWAWRHLPLYWLPRA